MKMELLSLTQYNFPSFSYLLKVSYVSGKVYELSQILLVFKKVQL
jgi:hypothetical protein